MAKIQNLKISELTPYPNNPRVNDQAVAGVVASIKAYGFIGAIIVNKDKVIINGHTRVKAMKELGADTIPGIVVDHLTEEQEKALRIADNKTAEVAEWNEELLRAELKALQEAGFDMGALGFDTSELDDLLGGTADEVGQTDPNEVPEAPEVAVSKPGEVYALGPHRLLCGDSTKPEDVAKVAADSSIDCWLTDPPYNVAYEGSNGLTIQNDSMEDSKFREFLRSAFLCAERALKPGAAFYIFHADSEGYNFRGACFDVGLRVRECLVWKKQALVLGRQDYQWIHEPCQPAGTMVLTVDGPKAIESLTESDRVISYDKASGMIKGYKNGGYAIKTASRQYIGRMYVVGVSGCETRATDNHMFTVRFNPSCKKKYCTYLMRRGDWWRVGMTKTYDARQFGVKTRLHQEKGDEAWIIGLYDDKVSAQAAEQTLTVKYGIPYTIWEPERFARQGNQRTKEQIAEIYAHLDLAEMANNARRLLVDTGRSERYPLFTKESAREKFSHRVTAKVCACNLLPDIMQVPMPLTPSKQKNFEWRSISTVTSFNFEGTVYSLAVEKFGHYIADGIVTHNCLYGWKEGAPHNWYGDRSQTTVMEFNKPKKNDVHPCLAPETRVMTSKGLKPIAELKIGEKVLSCDGRFHRVHLVTNHPYYEKIYKIAAEGQNEADLATHNHKYLVARKNAKGGHDISWVKAEDLKVGDFLMTPKMRDGAYAPVSELDAWCYGLWLAQGSLTPSGGKVHRYPAFSLDSRKVHLFAKLQEWAGKSWLGIYNGSNRGLGRTAVVFDHDKAKECVRLCGKRAYGKRIAEDVFAWKESLRRAFLNGYIDGDGWRFEERNEIRIHTVSPAIASQLKTLAWSLGYRPAVYLRKAKGGKIGDRVFKRTLPYYDIYLYPNEDKNSIRYGGCDFRLSRVKSIEARQYNGDVWNIGVEGTHTFQTANGITKNTMKPTEMLVYLLKNSTKRGDTVLDTFGGSGSTLIACQDTGRVCRTVELDPKYADVIRKRWAEHVHGEGCDWQKLTPAEKCATDAPAVEPVSTVSGEETHS